jgi:hypothetical protein
MPPSVRDLEHAFALAKRPLRATSTSPEHAQCSGLSLSSSTGRSRPSHPGGPVQ